MTKKGKTGNTLDYPQNATTKKKYDAFIRAYHTNGNNATQAAITAGYSAKSAAAKGNNLLRIVYICDELDKLQQKANEEYTITVEQRLKWAEMVISKGFRDQLDAMGNSKAENLHAVNGALNIMNQMLGAELNTDTQPISKVQIEVVGANIKD